MTQDLGPLLAAVRTNCHISDAHHAPGLSLCTFLLEMRELYRWEHGIALGAPVPQAGVGAWMTQREALWVSLEGEAQVPLPFAARTIDPYDAEGVNHAINPQQLVYGAGIGRFGKPQFFLGALERESSRDGMRVLIAGCEYARDLSAAPAAARDGTIYVRLDALRRWLWERVEAWTGKRPDGAMKAALAGYGFADDPDAALARMAETEAETLILHELGECRAGQILGPAWEHMLSSLTHRRAEIVARAARDHLADCLVTLPALLERETAASIDFWFANLDGMRRELFPRMGGAYAAWRGGDRGRVLREVAESGAAHWERVCMQILALHREQQGAADAAIEGLGAAAHVRL
jgi:hypothetical protein